MRSYPWAGEYSTIEEEQVFVFLLNGAATPASIEKFGWCEASGINERLPLQVVTGPVRDAILKAVNLAAQQTRAVAVRCARPLPPDAQLTVVWGAGISTPSGVPTSAARRLDFKVRKPFAASFTCERSSSRADCLPIRPLRLEFSSPVPRKFAERIVLVGPNGDIKPQLEQGRGDTSEQLLSFGEGLKRRFVLLFSRSGGKVTADPSDNGVSAVQFNAPLPEKAALRIELPKDLRDDAGRTLSNAESFPLQTRTAEAPALLKFAAATFGVLELNAEPTLPVTVRHVEANLLVKGLSLTPGPVKTLRVADDARIIDWLARLKRYDDSTLRRSSVERELGITLPPPPPPAQTPARKNLRYGEDNSEAEARYAQAETREMVQARTVSLLAREANTQRLSLPATASGDPRPFEVIGIPMPQAGFHVVEAESPRLGAALLDRDAPVYVRTSVLVTNLGVHFKLGAANSAVWVTTLDRAQPVPDAALQISDCRGQVVWAGRSDKQGMARVDKVLPELDWTYCSGANDDTGSREQGYFVSARKTDAAGRVDMAFVWSSWNQGIESWRFQVAQADQRASTRVLFHSVLDRSLLRAGQTVSMKHHARREQLLGLGLLDVADLPGKATITHDGSGQSFDVDLSWRAGKTAETRFDIPKDAKLGAYSVTLGRGMDNQQTASFRVEEFRLPVMTGRILPPAAKLIRPQDVDVGLQINYGNGGGAAGLPVRVSAQLRDVDTATLVRGDRFPGFRFAPPQAPRGDDDNNRPPYGDDYVDDNDEQRFSSSRDGQAQLVANKLAATLDRNGAGKVTLTKLPTIDRPRELLVQASYADPNGEVQTLSQTLPVWPSSLVLGIRTDSWVSVKQKLATQLLVLDTTGQPVAGVRVNLRGVAHHTSSVRKRLVGGFYAYDNQHSDDDLGQLCSGSSDARGLVLCDAVLTTPGQIELIAQTHDSAGRLAQAATSVWVTRLGEVWFGGDNQDRMDLIPEQRSVEPGQTARLQVRSPFRHATALLAIERNGIVETRVVTLTGRDPTIEIAVKPEWAPNVFVSVLAVRGRVHEVPWYTLFTWGWKSPADWWQAYRGDGLAWQAPTAMVDLARPAFKYGIAEIEVGKAAHRLDVKVTPDKASYPVRAVSQVRVKVSLPGGKPAPAGTEVTLAAVDEALLELMPNTSWDLLGALIRQRGYGVETATAQMQIIGKRHYGKKAAPAGGGGGQFPTRELFDTLLLWEPRVVLDKNGEALVKVPLNDSLSSFRIVAVADVVQGANAALFGTGSSSIRATQDLQIISGVPPLVREGDRYLAMFTLRNTTDKPVDAQLSVQLTTPGSTAATTTGSTSGSLSGSTLGSSPANTLLTPQGQATARTAPVQPGKPVAVGAALPTRQIRIEAQSAAELSWEVEVPYNLRQLDWTVAAQTSGARDRMKITQAVREAIPVTVQQATLMQLDKPVAIPIAPPAGAVAGNGGKLRGGIEATLRPRLGDGLAGVDEFFLRYPWSCLEQRASVAIGLRDTSAWRSVAEQLPLYLDEDGLANYFPPAAGWRSTGSDSLTAYLLAASDEARQLGHDFKLPGDTRERMERGLIDFVEGRLKREFWVPAFLKNGDLEVRKLAALEALSRSGKVQAKMLDSVQILPNQWPTGAVIDWLMILDRVKELPERDKRIAEAEQILRARLNMQGTRLGFSTERDDSWWWLMVNGDVNSTRMIQAVLARPAWKDDVPRLVTGTLQRQQAGHWSTTTANAWGSLAMEAFSKRFEREMVSGSTRAAFEPGGEAQTLAWSKAAGGGTLALGWPVGFGVTAGGTAGGGAAGAPASGSAGTPTGGPAGAGPRAGPGAASAATGKAVDAAVRLSHDGSGRPWLTLTSKAAVPVTKPFSSGYRIVKTVTPVEQKVAGSYSRGDVLRVSLEIDAQADMSWVVVNDPIPAGATLLGNGLGRDEAIARSGEKQDGRAWLAYEERSFEAFRAYYRYLPKGGLKIEYTVRLNNPGSFGLPATHVEAMYAPEMFGEAPNALLVVKP
ncbi:MAG: alpha-2-macroglobulin [Burkholderiales bacterium]|nr:alpha-2-macroglobulin [Burkholderiales bacterium]